jgi:AmmeMemoRadiSam system protein B
LQREVDTLLAGAHAAADAQPKALIAPHAGYIYSGPIAASAYRLLQQGRIQRVVCIAPSHRYPFQGLATSSADAFRSPLGDVPVDRSAVEHLLELPQVRVIDEAFAGEHALEVQLPFLQRTLDHFDLVPLLAGDVTAPEVASVFERLWGGEETLFVISSDLSHYHGYEDARRRDAATSQAIETLHPERIGYEDACGRAGVSGMLLAAKAHGLEVETLDLRNSGDTAGDRDRVVGYGAYVFH